MLDCTKNVSRNELAKDAGVNCGTVTKYLHEYGIGNKAIPRERKQELAEYIRRRFENARKASNENLPKGRIVAKKLICNWRVSLWGNSGWIVVRCGTREEMEAWAMMLNENGIRAQARRNEFRRAL